MADPLIARRIVADADELTRAAAEEVTQKAVEAVRAKGRFTLALSGGSTPKSLYKLLADPTGPFRPRIDWSALEIFWGDERHVPPDHADSNFRMAREALLDHVPVPAERIHRVRGEEPDAARAASLYEEDLRASFAAAEHTVPRFDLVLLGLGPDGHTASLFPGTEAVHEKERLVIAPFVAKFDAYRITLTPPVLNHAAAVLFVVSGAEKAEALAAVLEGERQVDRYPAQIVRPENGTLLWLVDKAAAERLQQS